MKIYLVKREWDSNRWFDNHNDLLKFLIGLNKNEKVIVQTIDSTIESEMTSKDTIKNIQDQIQRESAINTVLGDEFSQKAQIVITLFEKHAKRCEWDKTSFTHRGKKVYERLTTCPRTKKDFGKVINQNSEYLLYNVSDSVEWYSALLEIYGFKKMCVTCRREYHIKQTRYYKFDGCRTPDSMLKAFEEAKNKIKKK